MMNSAQFVKRISKVKRWYSNVGMLCVVNVSFVIEILVISKRDAVRCRRITYPIHLHVSIMKIEIGLCYMLCLKHVVRYTMD